MAALLDIKTDFHTRLHVQLFRVVFFTDLVDLVVCLSVENLDTERLRGALLKEMRLRKLDPLSGFEVPDNWYTSNEKVYRNLAKEAGIETMCETLESAVRFVANAINPVLANISAQE